jgi:hypothetical protein
VLQVLLERRRLGARSGILLTVFFQCTFVNMCWTEPPHAFASTETTFGPGEEPPCL